MSDHKDLISDLRKELYGGAEWDASVLFSRAIDALEQQAARIAELEAERDAFKLECSLMEHKVITCGVAASHPDANLSRTGVYAGEWNSEQANKVRALRNERDALKAQLEARDGEAVAVVESWTNGSYHRNYKLRWLKDVEAGTSLYIHPPTGDAAGNYGADSIADE